MRSLSSTITSTGHSTPRASYRSIKAAFEDQERSDYIGSSSTPRRRSAFEPASSVQRRIPFAEIPTRQIRLLSSSLVRPDHSPISTLNKQIAPPDTRPNPTKLDRRDARALSDRLRDLKDLESRFRESQHRVSRGQSHTQEPHSEEDIPRETENLDPSEITLPASETFSESVDRSVNSVLELKEFPAASETMSRSSSIHEDTFSAANSFDEIADEIADEKTHDFEEVDDSMIGTTEKFAAKPLESLTDDQLLSDYLPEEKSDSQKGTYHNLPTTVKRPEIPKIEPRVLGTITSAESHDSGSSSEDDGYVSRDDGYMSEPSESLASSPEEVTERDVTTSVGISEAERIHPVGFPDTQTTGTTGTGFTFSASPFVGLTTPSGRYRPHRFSGNMSEALVSIWDRFWSDDMRKILQIIRNRFKELLPHVRRFLAHIVAFWGGVTYIRRALSAFLRIMQRDHRVRELLHRLGWASSTTLRVFMSLCAMMLQATLQFYYLMRDRIIPQLRRVIPKCYYKCVVLLLRAARHSPWALILGPFSLTAAIESRKIPDPYFLHNKFGIPEDDTSFDFGGASTFASSTFFGTVARSGHVVQTRSTDDRASLRDSTFRDQSRLSTDVGSATSKGRELTESGYGDGKENSSWYGRSERSVGDHGDTSSVDYRDF